jgi:3-isopropylmalate dehydrogenase
MTSYRITLLPGDGIGPEITAVTRQLMDAVSRRHGFELVYDEQPMGGSAIDATGEPLPASTLEACKGADAVLLAAIGSPQYDRLPHEHPSLQEMRLALASLDSLPKSFELFF